MRKKSAERRIPVHLRFEESAEGFTLHIQDDAGISASACITHMKETAKNAERAMITLRENLGTLGTTIYKAARIALAIDGAWFIPASALNALRRGAVEALNEARTAPINARYANRQANLQLTTRKAHSAIWAMYSTRKLAFFTKNMVSCVIDPAFECQEEKGDVSLMITKKCLRYSFNLCPKQVKGIRADPMILLNGDEKLTMRFDCKPCEMHVIGKLKKNWSVQILPR